MPQLIINTYVSLMYELKKIGKVFKSKSAGTGPSSCGKILMKVSKNSHPDVGLRKLQYATRFH